MGNVNSNSGGSTHGMIVLLGTTECHATVCHFDITGQFGDQVGLKVPVTSAFRGILPQDGPLGQSPGVQSHRDQKAQPLADLPGEHTGPEVCPVDNVAHSCSRAEGLTVITDRHRMVSWVRRRTVSERKILLDLCEGA